MSGHVKLGEPGNLRDYTLLDIRQYHAQPVNPMAAKIGTGAGSYDDFMGWSFWVQEDWSIGAGHRGGHGVLFGDLATFQKGRLTLPLKSWPLNGTNASEGYLAFPWRIDGQIQIGQGGNYAKIAQWFPTPNPHQYQQFWILLDPYGATTVTLSIERGINTPAELVYSQTLLLAGLRPGPQWILFDLGSPQSFDPAYQHFLCITSTNVVSIPYWVFDATIAPQKALNAPSYAPIMLDGETITIGLLANEIYRSVSAGGWSAEEPVDIVQWDNQLYVYGRAYLLKLQRGAQLNQDRFALVTFEAPAGCTDLQVWNDFLYSAHGANGLWRYNGAAVIEILNNNQRQPATLLHAWNGFLYVAHQNKLWYTNGVDWAGPFAFGPENGYQIRGMVGLGELLYVSTDDGLWVLKPGDTVEGILQWPWVSATNGLRMVGHQGALFIPMKNRIFMLAQNGVLQDVWIDSATEIPKEYIGEIHSLCSTPLGLVATISPMSSSASASVWLMTNEGWHVLAILPPGTGAGRVAVDSANNRLWLATRCGLMWSLWWQPMATAPVQNPQQSWQTSGWCEWDWYTSELVDVDKDWESLTIFGENLSQNRPAIVYYKDAENSPWRWLGTATGDNVELRFEHLSHRPQGPKLKIGILLRTNDYHFTPSVRAIRVKHHPMLMDRWRWQLTLPVHDNVQMPDGSVDYRTAEEQRQHLEGLINRIPPALFEDVDGVQYEVKVIGATRQMQRYEWLHPQQRPAVDWLYTLTIEQVTNRRYLPAIQGTKTVFGVYEIGVNEMLEIGLPGILIVEEPV